MLSFAYKWLGSDKITVRCLPDFKGYKPRFACDRPLVQELRNILNEADVAIAHNGDRFDLPKVKTRCIIHGVEPPSPPKNIDTYKIAKKEFKFSKNSLDHLVEHFGIGRKPPTTGFNLWERCIEGDPKAWKKMRAYNKHDVYLLEGCYLRMRPWASNHPNLSWITREDSCPVCQSKKLINTGWHYLRTGRRQRTSCLSCGHRFTRGGLIKDEV